MEIVQPVRYVASPQNTFDPGAGRGADIEIAQRPAEELSIRFCVPTARLGAAVYQPVVDIAPAELITGIISDRGVRRAPYDFGRQQQ